MNDPATLARTHVPRHRSDRIARGYTKAARFFADKFFSRRYGHRAAVLETVAAVPDMWRQPCDT